MKGLGTGGVSVVKCTCCCSRGPEYGSQHTYGSSKLSLSPVPVPSAYLCRGTTHAHVQAKHTQNKHSKGDTLIYGNKTCTFIHKLKW